MARSLNDLGSLYYQQGRYVDAEPLHKRSLAISEKALGRDHRDVATSLNDLATLYDLQGQYSEAEPLYKRALAIREKALGPDHPDVALSLNNLALLYRTQGRYADAEPLYMRSLAVKRESTWSRSSRRCASVAQSGRPLQRSGSLCRCRTAAQALFGDIGKSPRSGTSRCCVGAEQSGSSIRERKGAMPKPNRCTSARWQSEKRRSVPIIPMSRFSLNNLADLYRTQGRYADALPIVQRTISQNTAR